VVELTPERKKKNISDLTNSDLPNGASTHFRHGFVTALGYWLCCTRDPWSNNSREVFSMMQKCWDYVYGKDLVYKIIGIRDVVYVVVSFLL
jgi:hypothetical protein